LETIVRGWGTNCRGGVVGGQMNWVVLHHNEDRERKLEKRGGREARTEFYLSQGKDRSGDKKVARISQEADLELRG